ncbi:MAG: TetR/AcrR family transcriptional regulator [Bdellovibrionales bacterium]|nr:TetR/AcrR family transcriptional regulator [Bdellovibrionales bacterium]
MSETAKDKIIAAAITLFAEKGYEMTSVRDIVSLAGVNIASINYHFGSKEGLFQYLAEEFAHKKFFLVSSVLEEPQSLEEFKLRLSMFMGQFLAMALNEQESFFMMHKNIDTLSKMAPETFKQIFLKTYNQFLNFVETAQSLGFIRKNCDARIIVQILFGSLIEMVRGNELRKNLVSMDIADKEFVDSYISTTIDLLLNGLGV